MKNKKAFVVLLLLCLGQLWIFAEERGYYYDPQIGQSIVYLCEYTGFTHSDVFKRSRREVIEKALQDDPSWSEIKKLSKRSERICWMALELYNYKPGESYGIVIEFPPAKEGSFVQIIEVLIHEDKTFEWYGIERYQ